MLKRFAILPLGLLFIVSCKEKGPAIDFGPKAADSAYVTAVETQQPRVIVVEEFTGVTCPNCPKAHSILKTLEENNPNRIAAIGIQPMGSAQASPVTDDANGTMLTRQDNRTKAGADLGTGIYGSIVLQSLPGAGIDRSLQGGSLYLDRNSWTTAVSARLGVPAKANIAITSNYNAGSRQAVIKVHVAYTGTVTGSQLLNVALVENNITDWQEDGITKVENYSHQHVLRDILTNPTGTAILTGVTIQPGQVYERTFVYTVNAAWNPDNCRIVAYVANNNGTDKEVQQGAEAALK